MEISFWDEKGRTVEAKEQEPLRMQSTHSDSILHPVRIQGAALQASPAMVSVHHSFQV